MSTAFENSSTYEQQFFPKNYSFPDEDEQITENSLRVD